MPMHVQLHQNVLLRGICKDLGTIRHRSQCDVRWSSLDDQYIPYVRLIVCRTCYHHQEDHRSDSPNLARLRVHEIDCEVSVYLP